jgi:hypothetical protein
MKKSQLRQLIREELQNEGLFGNSSEKENKRIQKALDRWVTYCMDEGDSEADILSVGQEYLQDSIDVYLGGKIDDNELEDKWNKYVEDNPDFPN